METVTVSEILNLLKSISKNAQTAVNFLENRILIGEINRPGVLVEKKIRKKRAKKIFEFPPIAPSLELPDADKSNAFYTKKKREKKEGETTFNV